MDDLPPELIHDADVQPASPLGCWSALQELVMRMTCTLLLVAAVLGCSASDAPRRRAFTVSDSTAVSATTAEGGVESMETMLARFQSGTPRVELLGAVSRSRAALTRRYLVAVARSDASALRDMHISRAEYAYLYFPSSKMMVPPYELPPDVAWMLHTAESNKGIANVLRRFAGNPLEFEGVRCPGKPLHEGPNIVWRDCVVRFRDRERSTSELPLFAAIIERDGRFKFFSYATSL